MKQRKNIFKIKNFSLKIPKKNHEYCLDHLLLSNLIDKNMRFLLFKAKVSIRNVRANNLNILYRLAIAYIYG